MVINLKPNSFFVFDLDDTLYPEIDYLKSAFRFIANRLSTHIHKDIFSEMMGAYYAGKNVFENIVETYGDKFLSLSVHSFLKDYQEHMPDIHLYPDASSFLRRLQYQHIPIGIITDGRSITQRNKLKALGIDNLFNKVIISEEFGSAKPDERIFKLFEEKYPGKEFWYVGDNTEKDFIAPALLEWKMICRLDNGGNIHRQDFSTTIPSLIKVATFEEIDFFNKVN